MDFLSPSLHLIHHSNNPKHFDKNFGFVFVFWDKLFGTYLDETNLKEIHGFGVEGTINITSTNFLFLFHTSF